MIILGIDPGLSGALCMRDDVGRYVAFDMPTLSLKRGGKNKREIDAHELARMLSIPIGHAFVEQIGAMPGQGVSSMFAMGKGYGIVLGILAARGTPYTLINPRKWKTALGVPAAKDGSRARASQLLPDAAEQWKRVKDDGRAEAAMIAHYGFMSLNNIARGVAAEAAAPCDLERMGAA